MRQALRIVGLVVMLAALAVLWWWLDGVAKGGS